LQKVSGKLKPPNWIRHRQLGTAVKVPDKVENMNPIFSDGMIGEFLYMDVNIHGMKVTALLDTGSSINIISKELFDKLPLQSKFHFRSSDEQKVKLANNQSVYIFGTASISVQTPCSSGNHTMLVYILQNTFHPLILGTGYFIAKNIVLDLSKFVAFREINKCTKVRCK
jgi:hypothetical protein